MQIYLHSIWLDGIFIFSITCAVCVGQENLDSNVKPKLSYPEALAMAQGGDFSVAVFEAFKTEISKAENSGTSEFIMYSFDVKINLGVALMQFGNANMYPASYYDQSEQLFLSVLSVHPEYEPAKSNLKALQRNRMLRSGESLEDMNDNRERLKQEQVLTLNAQNKVDKLQQKPFNDEQSAGMARHETCALWLNSERLLTIGIPTVPRKGNPRYLTQTVNAIVDQLPTRSDHPMFRSILVLVLNNRPGEHDEFYELRGKIEMGPYRHFFRFEEADISDESEFAGLHSPWARELNPSHDP